MEEQVDMIFHTINSHRNQFNVLALPVMYFQSLGWKSSEIKLRRSFVLKTIWRWFLVKVWAMYRPSGALYISSYSFPPLTRWATTYRRCRDWGFERCIFSVLLRNSSGIRDSQV